MSSGKGLTEGKSLRSYVHRIAVLVSRNFKDPKKISTAMSKLSGVLDRGECIVLVGDQPGLEKEINSKCTCVVLKPYNMYDATGTFSPKQFFVANRQKIDNADIVLIFRTELTDELLWAERYARERN